MSTHQLDASGARPLTITTNDPARTVATVQAKAGDDVVVTLGNFDYVEIPIPTTAGVCEIVVRKRTEKKIKRNERGYEVRDKERNVIYEEIETEHRTLRLRAFAYVSAHTEKETREGYPGKTPHSSLRAVDLTKDQGQPVWLSGEVVSVEKINLGYGVEAKS